MVDEQAIILEKALQIMSCADTHIITRQTSHNNLVQGTAKMVRGDVMQLRSRKLPGILCEIDEIKSELLKVGEKSFARK